MKNLQPSMQALIRPMLLISLLLHGAFLFIPTGQSESEAPPEPEEEAVTLTQLPPVDQPVAQATPSPRATPAPRPRPSALPRARVTAPPPARRSAPPAIRSSTPRPTTPSNVTPAAPSAPPASTASEFLRDFPRYPGAQQGSFGLPPAFDAQSQKTTDGLTAVDGWFQQQLTAKGYTPAPMETDSNRVVYEVSRQGMTQYLTLIRNPEGEGTNILISAQPLPADLGSANVESPETAQFFSDLSFIPNPDGNDDSWQRVSEPSILLTQPASFFASLGSDESGFYIEPELRPQVRRAVVAIGQPDPQALFSGGLQNSLEIGAYEITPQGNYGGGLLYQLRRDGVTGYLSLVPATNGQDTVIFIWDQPPQ